MVPELVQLETRVIATIQGLNSRQTQATPLARPEKWSIQQIVEHLLKTYRLTVAAVGLRLDQPTVQARTLSFSQRLARLSILGLGQYPPRLRTMEQAVPPCPSTLRSTEELLARLRVGLAEMEDATSRAQSRFGTQPIGYHPRLGPLSAKQWHRFHLVHGLHHLRQIRAIRADHAF